MGRQHQQRRQMSRDEQIALLKAHGETDESITALLAQSQLDQQQAATRTAAAGPPPRPTPKDVYRLRNWSAYNAALVQRGLRCANLWARIWRSAPIALVVRPSRNII